MPQYASSVQYQDNYLYGTDKQYKDRCLNLANDLMSSYPTIDAIRENQNRINSYRNIGHLEAPRNIRLLEEEKALPIRKIRAAKCILSGKLFTEHAAAGEATRLGLGTKYLLNIKKNLSLEQISERMSCQKGQQVTEYEIVEKAGCRPDDLLSLSLGTRHMVQFSFDIYNLAKEFNADPKEVLTRQKMLIVLNEKSADTIIREMTENRFFGFMRENVMFMIQKAYHGIRFRNGQAAFDKTSSKRLHNHGHIMIQQTLHGQVFHLNKTGKRVFIEPYAYGDYLEAMEDKITYNIEDLEFLTNAIDYEALGFALERAEKGVRMLMEIVKNDPENPQKGGMAAYDTILKKNVMIEGLQLMGIKNEEMIFLNKNFNHYPRPYDSWSVVKIFGLNMPVSVKNGYLYFQPVQGDMNFLVNTEFYRRKNIKPIRAWKSIANTPLAIRYMRKQDQQDGFRDYAESVLGKQLN
ncbi:MAG: hypothetical protein KJ737_22700 [Proteobacteria bacterium]|nr:hypothetical protein [Pseudomonadota bacterium]